MTTTAVSPEITLQERAPQKPVFRIYNLPGEEDFFLNHANAVLLGFLGAVQLILVALMGIAWVGFKLLG